MAESTKVQSAKLIELFAVEMLSQVDREANSRYAPKAQVRDTILTRIQLKVVRIEHLEKILPRLLMDWN